MKQITQRELIEIIKEKKHEAELDRNREHDTPGDYCVLYGEIEAYQDLICYLNSVEIVPEEQIVTTIPKAKQEELGITQDELKKMIENTSKPQDIDYLQTFKDLIKKYIDMLDVGYEINYEQQKTIELIEDLLKIKN